MTLAERLRNEGREEGWSKGRSEGRSEGWSAGRSEVAINMLNKGMDITQVALFTEISEKELRTKGKILDKLLKKIDCEGTN